MASEHEHECSKRSHQENLPEIAPEKPGDPGDTATVSGDVQNTRGGPRSIRNKHVNETDAPSQDKGPGGHRDERDELGAIEDDLERQSDGYGNDTDVI